MKFVYVCRGCGSADITEKCGKLINEEEIIVCYDTYRCNNTVYTGHVIYIQELL